MRKIKFLFPALSILALTVVSCTKEEITTASDTSPLVASATIEATNELDIQTGTKLSYDNLTISQTAKSSILSCGQATLDPQTTTFPKTYYVNYGTAGCTTNSITRKGKLKITFSNYITETGSTMTIERIDYYVNGNKIEGKIVYKNTTTSPTEPQWTRTITDGKFTNSKGEYYLSTGTHTVKQTAGVATTTLEDNTYEMTEGTHTATKQNGATITLTVASPLVKNHTCEYVSKGKLKVESTLLNGVIDYGNGDCDNKATYTQGGIAFPITM